MSGATWNRPLRPTIEGLNMATRMGTAHEFAARCQHLPGWTVTKPRSLSGGYKIKAPDGWTTQVHLTSSDRNAAKTIERELMAHGLAQSEEQWERQRAQLKQATLDKQRKEAEERTAKLLAQATMTAKARGPYAIPEEVEKEWFTAHPAPWHRWVIMTPDLAGYLLDNHNTDNRPLKPSTWRHYERVILAGGWHLTHQGMALDIRGILQDGQHRLTAIKEAGVPVPVSFYVGMPEENFKAIDEGDNRKAKDLFGKDGEKHAVVLQSTVKLVAAYEDPVNARRAMDTKQTNETMYDAFHGDAEELRAAVLWGKAHHARAKMNPTACAAAAYLLRKRMGPENPYLEAFLRGLMSGFKGGPESRIALDLDDPRQKLRQHIENLRNAARRTRLAAFDNLCLIIIAWNQVTENHRPQHSRFTEAMDVPGIQLCAPTGRYASAIPDALRGEIEYAEQVIADQKAAREG